MTQSPQHSFRAVRRFGQTALIAFAFGGLTMLPLGAPAFANNGNGHSHDSGHAGHDHGGGQSGDHGNAHDGQGNSGASDNGGAQGTSDDQSPSAQDTGEDSSMSPKGLGKLNGFFHASSVALAKAAPNSAIGRISRMFRDALSGFAAAPANPDDPNATPGTAPTVGDLGDILAQATNKPVTSTQVKAIIDRLAEQNPDDAGIGGLAASIDDATAQDIADAANAAKANGETTESADDGVEPSGTN